jgi:hypothetical protein
VSRSTKNSYVNLIEYKPEVLTGYISKITESNSKKYIGSTKLLEWWNILVIFFVVIQRGK